MLFCYRWVPNRVVESHGLWRWALWNGNGTNLGFNYELDNHNQGMLFFMVSPKSRFYAGAYLYNISIVLLIFIVNDHYKPIPRVLEYSSSPQIITFILLKWVMSLKSPGKSDIDFSIIMALGIIGVLSQTQLLVENLHRVQCSGRNYAASA